MFFIASKILGIFLEPLNLFVFLFALCLFMWWLGWKKLARRGAVLFGLLFALCAFTQFPDYLLLQLETRQDETILESQKNNIVGIIVLGGAISVNKHNKSDWYHLNDGAERISEGIYLAKRFPDIPLVYTGGNGELIGDGGLDADGFTRVLERLGGVSNEVILEKRAKNTRQNAKFTAQLLAGKSRFVPQGHWLLVTSAFHMIRAETAFRRLGFSIIAWPTDYRANMLKFPWITTAATRQLKKFGIYLHEVIGMIAYKILENSQTGSGIGVKH